MAINSQLHSYLHVILLCEFPRPLISCAGLCHPDPVWCPYLLLPRAALTLKAFLLLQPWSGSFTMDITQV